MIASLLFFAAASQTPALYVREKDELAWVGSLVEGDNTFVLPLTTRYEMQPRAVLHRNGVQIVFAAPAGAEVRVETLELHAVEHLGGERVMRVNDNLRIVSNLSLPRFARVAANGDDVLPLVARFDGEGFGSAGLRIAAGLPGSELILIPRNWDEDPAWIIDARDEEGNSETIRNLGGSSDALSLDGAKSWLLLWSHSTLDHAFHASTRRIESFAELISFENFPETRMLELAAGGVRSRLGRGPARPWIELGGPCTYELSEIDLRGAFMFGNGIQIQEKHALQLEFALPVASERDLSFSVIVRARISLTKTPREAAAKTDEIPAPAYFRDVAREAGIHDVHFEGPELQLDIRPTMGPGAAWGDFDGDGLQDLYLVQGGGRAGSDPPRNRLLRNRGDGRFEHVPGADDNGAGMGALFFDLEGDGDLDLYVANYGPDALYRNDGKDGFVDVSAQHELAGDGWSAGVCAADYDLDGDLDLYVTSYLVYDPALMPPVEELPGYAREDPIEMLPFAFPGARNAFLENVNGKLVDRTEELGLADEQGRGMQPVFWDFDLDGDQDLYVANDVSFNVLYRNEGDGTFKDISFQTGMDDPRGGMGVATGDVDGDGDPDLFLTNWELEANALYLNNHVSTNARKSHSSTFKDATVSSRLGQAGIGVTSWGCVLFDADNDGDLDLFIPNGYTSPDYESTGICVGQSNQFFLNDGAGRFVDASDKAGPAVTAKFASRAAALCDYDRDGRLDLCVTNNNGPYQLLHNDFESAGHWLGIELKGSGSNTSAVGARIMLETGGATLTRDVQAGSGYLAGHALGVHFGLGKAESVQKLTIRWPSGGESEHEVADIDRWIVITDPAALKKSEK